MSYRAEVVVCSQIKTKHINTVSAECKFSSVKPVGARNQWAVKGSNHLVLWLRRHRVLFIKQFSVKQKENSTVNLPLSVTSCP